MTKFINYIQVALLVCLFVGGFSYSQTSLADDPQNGSQVGSNYRANRDKASEYFAGDAAEKDRSGGAENSTSRNNNGGGENMLMVHFGGYINSQSYNWGAMNSSNTGDSTYGVTYFVDHWGNLDVNLRADFNTYKIDDKHPTKLSLLPLITFPRFETHFPLYFGFGAGPGVYFTQIPGSSSLSLDYQLVAGLRFMNLVKNAGFFTEFGLKNHINLFSPGQFNGTFVAVGAVFTF